MLAGKVRRRILIRDFLRLDGLPWIAITFMTLLQAFLTTQRRESNSIVVRRVLPYSNEPRICRT